MTEMHTIEITRSKDGKFKTTKKIRSDTLEQLNTPSLSDLFRCIFWITMLTFIGIGVGLGTRNSALGYIVEGILYYILFVLHGDRLWF